MKIGSFLPLQSNPGKQPGQALSLPNPETHSDLDASSSSRSQSKAINPIALESYIAAAEQTAAESPVFNLDRDFSHRTQHALSAYLTTESYQSYTQGELVGVDLYV